MKRIAVWLIGVLMACGCSGPRVPSDGKIIVSGYVPFTLVQQIAGEKAHVEMVLPPGAEPHGFEPTPGTMAAVHRAAAFLYVSPAIEPWAQDVAAAAGKHTRVVALADATSTDDPHVWMDFDEVRRMARRVADELAQISPDNKDVYQTNLARFETELDQLDQAFQQGLADCQTREVVHIGHLAFGALARRYRLELLALAGTSHEGEHSVRKLAGLVKHIRKHHVKAVFTEEAVSERLAQTVAAETGTEILPLYTVEHVTAGDFNNHITYADFMRRNLAALRQGLRCRP